MRRFFFFFLLLSCLMSRLLEVWISVNAKILRRYHKFLLPRCRPQSTFVQKTTLKSDGCCSGDGFVRPSGLNELDLAHKPKQHTTTSSSHVRSHVCIINASRVRLSAFIACTCDDDREKEREEEMKSNSGDKTCLRESFLVSSLNYS